MADLKLTGVLNLTGSLDLKGTSGGKVKVGSVEALVDVEALVEVTPSDPAQCSSASPVILPPPPATPLQPQPTAWIVASFNKTVKAGGKPMVALGMAMQGQAGGPAWPGMLLPSSNNATVKINQIAINVVGDMAVIFPSGGSATFGASGQ